MASATLVASARGRPCPQMMPLLSSRPPGGSRHIARRFTGCPEGTLRSPGRALAQEAFARRHSSHSSDVCPSAGVWQARDEKL